MGAYFTALLCELPPENIGVNTIIVSSGYIYWKHFVGEGVCRFDQNLLQHKLVGLGRGIPYLSL